MIINGEIIFPGRLDKLTCGLCFKDIGKVDDTWIRYFSVQTEDVKKRMYDSGLRSFLDYHKCQDDACVKERKDSDWDIFKLMKPLPPIREPKIGEKLRCGICFGECEVIDQDFIDNFKNRSEESKEGLYEPFEDVFLSYDGCEEVRDEQVSL